jgi:preprotein translocase subunit SecB
MTEQKDTKQEVPVFRMQKMYIKDLSFENPNAPNIFLVRNQEPKVDFNLQVNSRKIDDDHWEVALAITAKIMDKNAEDTVMFVVEIEHCGVFLLKNIPSEHVRRVLAVDCPIMLFPYTRQVVTQVSVDGGFMPFLMEPINFIALYENAQRQSKEKQQ